MELFSVRVQWVRGGVDLTIRVGRHPGWEKAGAVEADFFTCNSIQDWTDAAGYHKPQGAAVFNALYAAAYAGDLKLEYRCNRDRCSGKYCKGVHELSSGDFIQLRPKDLGSAKHIGEAGTRWDIVTGYRQHLSQLIERRDTGQW